MKIDILRGDFDKLGLSKVSAERIRSTNYHLTDYMEEALIRHQSFAQTFGLKKEDIETLRQNEPSFRKLMGSPFMVVSPTLGDVADWKSLIGGGTTTIAVDKVRQQTPSLDSVDKILLYYNNRAYVWLLVELLLNWPTICGNSRSISSTSPSAGFISQSSDGELPTRSFSSSTRQIACHTICLATTSCDSLNCALRSWKAARTGRISAWTACGLTSIALC
jgi:hypothetical protein